MAYYGNNLPNGFAQRVDDKQSCINKCIERTDCHYWTYKPHEKKCWLKSSDRGRTSDGNYVSGKICGKAGSWYIRTQEGATCPPNTDVISHSECKDAGAALGYR